MTMKWQVGRELAGITLDDNTSISYTYNTDGMRTCKNVGGTKTYYYYDDSNNLVGLTQGSTTMFFYYDTNGSPVSMSYNGTMYYYVKNLQGDIVKIINKNGTVYGTYTYDSWGNIISSSGDPFVSRLNPLRYRGYVYDTDTGLYYLQSRYYDPITGRFLNADDTDFIGAMGTVLSTNLFTYCENNPTNKIDPNGFFSIPRWLISFSIDSIIWSVFSAGAATFSFLTQPIKAVARSAGKAFIKARMRGILLKFSKTLANAIIKVAKFLLPVVKKAVGWLFRKWAANLSVNKLSGMIAAGIASVTANSFLNSLASNITVFLSVGGLVAGLWDWWSDKNLNGWIKLW